MKSKHYVNPSPFDPNIEEALTPEQERYYMATQWQLMWWKLKRHKLAVISGCILAFMYFSVIISEILAPYSLSSRNTDFIYAPPQTIHLFHEDKFVGPFVYGLSYRLNMVNLKREYREDLNSIHQIRFFCRGDTYKLWGAFNSNIHVFCPGKNGTLFLLGTDRLGRDILSRIIYGTRISLTVGLLGIVFSFIIGITIGGLAGYYGGWIDNFSQRIIEIIRSFPELPLWMALSASLPVTWSPILVYFGITIMVLVFF